MTPQHLLNDDELAAMCQVQPSTVKRWRREKTGPKVVWLTPRAPRYRLSDVESWLASRVA